MADGTINDKEWLEIAWKHFQQHAQQRILYFNYFVVFSTILSTGLITTLQNNYQVSYLGIGTGLIQIFLSYIFWKIDERNKFLTQHAESVIKEIEKDNNGYKIFVSEEVKTDDLNNKEQSRFFLFRQQSHGKSYRIIFFVFFIWGVIGIIVSSFHYINRLKDQNEVNKVNLKEVVLNKTDTIMNNLEFINIEGNVTILR